MSTHSTEVPQHDADYGDRRLREIVIRPPQGLSLSDFIEIFAYRSLLLSMVKRHARSEYESSRLGILWAFARPLLMTLAFVLLKAVAMTRTGVEIAYPLYLYTGLIFWFWFTDSVMGSASSLRADAGLLRKVYFPRLISPLVPVLGSLWTLLVAALPVLPASFFFGAPPGWKLFILPFVILQTGFLAFGLGLIFAALTIASRDWERFLSLCLYVGLFASPVIFTPDIIPENVRGLAFLNPMTGALLAFRAALFDSFALPLDAWLYSWLFSIAALGAGILIFRRAERALIDTI